MHRQVVEGRNLTQQGIEAMHRRDWQRAEHCFAEAKKSCPYDVQNRLHYSEVLWRTGKRSEGIREIREALELSPEEPAILTRLGRMYLEVGELASAEAQARQALEHNPRWADAWVLSGDVAARRGEWELAKQAYIRGVSHTSEPAPLIQLRLAETYRSLRQPGLALACLAEIETGPTDAILQADVLIQQALAMRDQNRFAEAADRLESVVQKGDAGAPLMALWAECELQAGRLARADWALRQCLEIDPTHPQALALAERLPHYQQQTAQALQR